MRLKFWRYGVKLNQIIDFDFFNEIWDFFLHRDIEMLFRVVRNTVKTCYKGVGPNLISQI